MPKERDEKPAGPETRDAEEGSTLVRRAKATTDARRELADLAIDLDAIRGRLVRMRETLAAGGDWPEDMRDGRAAPSLAYRLHGDASTLLEEYVEPARDLVRAMAALTFEGTVDEWRGQVPELASDLADWLARMGEDAAGACGALEGILPRVADDQETASLIDGALERLRATAAGLAELAKRIQGAVGRNDEDGGKGDD